MKSITQKTWRQGFSLIELLVVLAITGILVKMTISAYQGYTISEKVSEGIALGDGLKPQITDYFIQQGTFPANNTAIGYSLAGTEFAGKYVSTVTTVGTATTATITITFGTAANVPSVIQGMQIRMIGSQASIGAPLTWLCGPATGTNPVAVLYLPGTCRQ